MHTTTAPRSLIAPDDPRFDGARRVQPGRRPAAGRRRAPPRASDDVVAAVHYARDNGLRVAPQTTGHNAGAYATLEGTVLVKTTAMDGRRGRRRGAPRARALAGSRWKHVSPPSSRARAWPRCTARLRTSASSGYSLGGGIGWLARKHGLQANSVTAIELVTADGELVRADAEHNADLFWALRGGGGNFGVVTAIEFELYPVDECTPAR